MMLTNKFTKLILVFVLFLFAITTTGTYTWAPVLVKNLDHHHEVVISADTAADSSQWSLAHIDDQPTTAQEDTKNHSWKSYDEPQFHHTVKPIQAVDQVSIDPVFLISFLLPLILFFLHYFERLIRIFDVRKRLDFLCNSYTYSKSLIVLRN